MHAVLFTIHLIGAILMLTYVAIPFLATRLAKSTRAAGSRGTSVGVKSLSLLNRIGQLALVIELVTGVLLLVHHFRSLGWIFLVAILFLAIAAVTGILGTRIRHWSQKIQSGQQASGSALAVRALSWLALALLIVIIIVMVV